MIDKQNISRRSFSTAAAALLTSVSSGSNARDKEEGRENNLGIEMAPDLILNARAFGAKGDGLADDGPALQRFLDRVVSNGRHGYIPSGRYRITTPLRIGDDTGRRYRGFTIEGAGRTGLGQSGGTIIVLDSGGSEQAVVLWSGNAWRDGRFTSLGLACLRPDSALYGLLIQSSEVSHLDFEYLHVEGVVTAFGLLQGAGANGEFCSWSHIQTWNVRNFFFSDAGQAYGLRFRDSFCYYRGEGTLFRFDTNIVGGGCRLINFDASPVRRDRASAPTERANTTLFSLSDKHNAPITVVGGRFEHITTLIEVNTSADDVIIHNKIQFIGCDFTTDLNRDGIGLGKSTIWLRNRALADIYFLGCSFSSALHQRLDMIISIIADRDCRGSIDFEQCGYWGYCQSPKVTGPIGERFRVFWRNCSLNNVSTDGDWHTQTKGHRYDRQICEASAAPTKTNLLRQSSFVTDSSIQDVSAPWLYHGEPVESAIRLLSGGWTSVVLRASSGLYQDVIVARPQVHYRALIQLDAGYGILRISLVELHSGQIVDEISIIAADGVTSAEVHLHAKTGRGGATHYRLAIDNIGRRDLEFKVSRQQVSDDINEQFIATLDKPIFKLHDGNSG